MPRHDFRNTPRLSLVLLRIAVLALGVGAAVNSGSGQIFDPTPIPGKNPGWKLVSVTVDPQGKSGDNVPAAKSLQITRGKVTIQVKNSTLEATFSEPPVFVGVNDTATMEVSTSYSGNDDNVYMSILFNLNGAFHSDSYQPLSLSVGCLSNSSFKRNSGHETFIITPERGFPEASIYPAVSYGATEIPWAFEAKYVWVESYSAEPTPTPPGECAELLDRYLAARFEVLMLQDQLELWRGLEADYERQWNALREEGFLSGVFDVASMVLTGGASIGAQAERMALLQAGKFTVKSAARIVFESAAKALMKESAKEFTLWMTQEKGWDPVKLLGQKPLEGPGKKMIAAAAGQWKQRQIMEMIWQGKGNFSDPIFNKLRAGGAGSLPFSAHVEAQYAQAWSEAAGILLDAGFACYGAWTTHGKLEALRDALRHIRDRRIVPAERKLNQAKQDLDVAKNAYDGCLKFHPEEKIKP
jgi:hypothetical protein